MGGCCRKLFLCLTYPSFSNVESAEVGVAWEHAVANCFLQTYIPLFYTVSAEVGVAWESKVAECSVK